MLLTVVIFAFCLAFCSNDCQAKFGVKPVGSLYAESPQETLETCKPANTKVNSSLSPVRWRSCEKMLAKSEARSKQYVVEARCTRQLLKFINDRLTSVENGFTLNIALNDISKARFLRLSDELLSETLASPTRKSMCETLQLIQQSIVAVDSTTDIPFGHHDDHEKSLFSVICDNLAFQFFLIVLTFLAMRLFAKHLWSPLTMAGIIMGCFFLSISFNCLRQYNERVSERDDAIIRMHECQTLGGVNNKNIDQKLLEPSFFRVVGSSVLPWFISPKPFPYEPDSCAHRRRIATMNPILRVDPWEAVVSTFSKTILTPMRLIFEYIAEAVNVHGWIIGTGCLLLLCMVIYLLRPCLVTMPTMMPRMPNPDHLQRRSTVPSIRSNCTTPVKCLKASASTPATPKEEDEIDMDKSEFENYNPIHALPLPALASPSPDRRRDLKKMRQHKHNDEQNETKPLAIRSIDNRRLSM